MQVTTYEISPNAAQALAVFAGNLPTFIAVVLAWMNSNARLSDIKSDLQRQITDLRNDTLRENQNTRDLLRSEFHRVEEVMDARLKHL